MTLDEIADNPQLAATLKRSVARKMIYRAIAVQQACYVALLQEQEEPTEDEILTVEQAARLLGIAPKTLANGASTVYKGIRVHNMSRRLAFSRRAIEALQQERGLTPVRPVLAVASRRLVKD